MKTPTTTLAFLALAALTVTAKAAEQAATNVTPVMTRTAERLDRGLLAMKKKDGSVYLGWRLFGKDAAETVFEVYRKEAGGNAVKLATVSDSTNFTDKKAPATGKLAYHIVVVAPGKAPVTSKAVTVDMAAEAKDYIRVSVPEKARQFMTPAVADLNGDGSMDYLLKTPDSYLDPAGGNWHKDTRSYKIHAISSDGTPLWMNDLGKAIEMGVWYSPYIAYDFDGDGKAEVAVKTGETTNKPDAEPVRDKDGRVIDDREYVSVWNGTDGKEMARAPWPDKEGYKSYNTYSRNLMGVAYLDGKTPSIIVARGTYGMIKIIAYNYSKGKLTEVWKWNSTMESEPGYHGDGSRSGAGSHFMHAADVDGDGRDEIIYGSFVLDDNGKGLWCLARKGQGKISPGGHPDGTWIGDILPARPGLEIFLSYEKWQEKNGACLVDARTGELIWGLDKKSGHFHKAGLCADIDARHPGMECFAKDMELSTKEKNHSWLWAANGTVLLEGNALDWDLQPWTVYWDGDAQREMIISNKVVSYPDGTETLDMEGSARTILVADIMGDWREEIIRSSNTNEIRVYTSTIPATTRRPTLLEDPIYRIDVANNSMGYGQSPMVSRPFADGK